MEDEMKYSVIKKEADGTWTLCSFLTYGPDYKQVREVDDYEVAKARKKDLKAKFPDEKYRVLTRKVQ